MATKYDPNDYPPFAVTADLVVFTIADDELCALTVSRGADPFAGQLALPGGFVQPDEDLEAAAVRELKEETGIGRRAKVHLEQLASYGAPKRDPRMRVVSVAYLAFAANLGSPAAASDAASAQWTPVTTLLAEQPLAFDHNLILADGLERCRAKLEYTTLATTFCQPEFTVGELREVYQAVWATEIDPRNFHRKVLASKDFVEPTGNKTNRGGGRPAQLFKAGPATELFPPLGR